MLLVCGQQMPWRVCPFCDKFQKLMSKVRKTAKISPSFTLLYSGGFSLTDKAIRMGVSIFKESLVGFPDYDVFLSMGLVFFLPQHCAAFYLGLHSLSKYPTRRFQYTKG